jgi:hypothetical protein
MNDFDRLLEKLRAIEALHARPGSPGEGVAAGNARDRILERLRELGGVDRPEEFRFSFADHWHARVFVALLRRYEIRPFRRRGQRQTTVMARVSKRFVDETLWPQYLAFSESLSGYLDEVTNRVIADVLHGDLSDTAEDDEPKELSLGVTADAEPATAAPTRPAAPPESFSAPPAQHGDEERRRKNEAKRRRKAMRRA